MRSGHLQYVKSQSESAGAKRSTSAKRGRSALEKLPDPRNPAPLPRWSEVRLLWSVLFPRNLTTRDSRGQNKVTENVTKYSRDNLLLSPVHSRCCFCFGLRTLIMRLSSGTELPWKWQRQKNCHCSFTSVSQCCFAAPASWH